MNSAKSDNLLRKSLRISTIEGIFAQVYGTFATIGSGFVVKLLIILKADPIHFSLLTAIGQISQVFQPLGVAVTHNLSNRKKACVTVTAIGRSLSLFLGVSLLFTSPHTGIWFVLLLLFCSASLLSIGGNIWIAWISDLVPTNFRGRFFSRRNQFILFAGIIVGYLGSFAVDLFDVHQKGINLYIIRLTGLQGYVNPIYQGKFITALFVFATLMGLLGLGFLSRQPEKKADIKKESLLDTYKLPLKDKNFRKLLLFGMWWMFAIGVGAAFWSPFMLKKLQMSLFEIQIYSSLHMITSLLAFRFWGKFIDRHGNKTTMIICVLLGGFNPMLWLFMNSVNHSVIWFEAISSGFMWAGAGIVTTNFVLSLAPRGQGQVYSGLYGALGGLCMMLTTLLSGFMFPAKLKLLFLNLEPEQVLFGITGFLRWSAIIPLALISEARSTSLKNLSQLFWVHVANRVRQFKP